MTPKEIRDWRKALGFTQERAAAVFGVTTRGYAKWEAGESPIDERTALAAKAFLREYRSKHGTTDGRPLLYVAHAYLGTDSNRESLEKYLVIARNDAEAVTLVAGEDEIKAVGTGETIYVVAEAVADAPLESKLRVLDAVSTFAMRERRRDARRSDRRTKVKVYKFEKYDILTDKSVVARRMATRQFIEAVGGSIVDGTELEVDVSLVDGNGQAASTVQP